LPDHTSRGLAGRVALITGAASGLGLSHARTLGRAGAKVVLADLERRTAEVEPGYKLAGDGQLAAAVDGLRAEGVEAIGVGANVHSQDELDAAVEAGLSAFGRLDILVANAGIAMVGPALDMPRADWDLILTTNLTGVWQAAKAAAPPMIEQGGGRMILISSAAGFKPMANLGAYSATKAAVIALAKVLAVELAEHKITVNAICPSTVPSGINYGLAEKLGVPWASLVDGWLEGQAIKELATPDDVSAAVEFLASDAARMITGVALPVDAGMAVL
jgi:NAD(P)-dependent dehydrogenase (short-subunit alcohol dehydrogenase family)